jgi:hypothetical protein
MSLRPLSRHLVAALRAFKPILWVEDVSISDKVQIARYERVTLVPAKSDLSNARIVRD